MIQMGEGYRKRTLFSTSKPLFLMMEVGGEGGGILIYQLMGIQHPLV